MTRASLGRPAPGDLVRAGWLPSEPPPAGRARAPRERPWQRRLRAAAESAPTPEGQEFLARASAGYWGLQRAAALVGWKPSTLLAQLLLKTASGALEHDFGRGAQAELGFGRSGVLGLLVGALLGVVLGGLVLAAALSLAPEKNPQAGEPRGAGKKAQRKEGREPLSQPAPGRRARWVGGRRWKGGRRPGEHTLARRRAEPPSADALRKAAEELQRQRDEARAQQAAALFRAALGGGAAAGRRWDRAAGRLKNSEEELAALEARALRVPAPTPEAELAASESQTLPAQPCRLARARRPKRLLRLGLLLLLGAMLAAHRAERIGEASNPGPTNDGQRQRALRALEQMGLRGGAPLRL